MDNLDRMYRHLVRTIRARFPQYLTQPFDVATLQSTILPYRLHRRELGLESNDDYEVTLTELLAGMRDYLVVDDPMRETLKRELAAKNADPAAYKQFLTATVALSPTALRSLEAGPDDPSTPLAGPAVTNRASVARSATPAAAAAPAPTASTSKHATQTPGPSEPVVPPSMPAQSRSGAKAITPQPGERCRACNEVLPPGRPITFCPHCGQNLTTMNCPACGSELEFGWKFCPICGRSVGTTSD
jgi:RNA polymerase subunit RPABC4/transcription elongation factor Spt4